MTYNSHYDKLAWLIKSLIVKHTLKYEHKIVRFIISIHQNTIPIKL